MDANQIMQWVFQGIVGGAVIYGVQSLKDLKSSIDELNIKMATVIERIAHQDAAVQRHENQIEKLEARLQEMEHWES